MVERNRDDDGESGGLRVGRRFYLVLTGGIATGIAGCSGQATEQVPCNHSKSTATGRRPRRTNSVMVSAASATENEPNDARVNATPIAVSADPL